MVVSRHGLQVSNTFHFRREHLFMRTICSTNTIYSKYLEVEVRIHYFVFQSYSVLSTSVSQSTSTSASVSTSSKSYTTLLMPYTQSEPCCVNS